MTKKSIVVKGTKYSVTHCLGAEKTLLDALRHVNNADVMRRKLIHQFKRLADGHQMSKENFPKEGALPNGTKFNAIKKIPVRAYCWLSSKYPNTYFISHYIYKDFDKLKDKDTCQVCENWKRIEEGHDEF